MKRLLLALACCSVALAQSSPDAVKLSAPPPPAVSFSYAAAVGAGGYSTYYYWVIANYGRGAAFPSSPAVAIYAAASLSTGNYVQVSWSAPPITPLSYDVLRTSIAMFPVGSCTCAVATGVSALSLNDKGGALSSYTVPAAAPGSFASIYLDSVRYSSGQLRQVIDGVDSSIGSGGSGNATQLQGRNLAATAPSDTNVICWSQASSQWQPCVSSGSGNATQLQGRNISSSPPIDTNTLCWSAAFTQWQPCSAGSGNVTASSLGAGQLVIGAGGTAIQTPAATATLDSLGNLAVTTVKAGSSAPPVSGSGIMGLAESSGQACAIGGDCLIADITAHRMKLANNNGSALLLSQVVALGTAAMPTTSIASAACSSAVTVSATGVLTTDVVWMTANADPTGTTGYGPNAAGSLYIWAFPTAGAVNFKVCNNTAAAVTPGALTLNWMDFR